MRRWAIGLLLFLNVALRAWFFHIESNGLTIDTLNNPDERNYLTYARELRAQGPSWLLSERSLSGPPGQEFYLALAGTSIPTAKALSVLLSALTLLPTIVIAKRLSTGQSQRRVVTAAALLFTLCPPILRIAPTLLTEPPTTFFVTSGLATALTAGDEGLSRRARLVRWLMGGALVGMATLFRMSTLLLPLWLMAMVALARALPSLRRKVSFDTGETLRGLGAFGLGVFLIVAPLIAKNGVAFGHWKLKMGSGALLYLGADPKTDGHEPYFSQYNFDAEEVTRAHTYLEPEGDRLLALAARHEVARAPFAVFARRIEWPLRLLVGQPTDAFWPGDSFEKSWALVGPRDTWLCLGALAWRVVVVAFAVAFFVKNWNREPAFVLGGTFAYVLLALLPYFVIPRYSIPFLPFLAAAAAAWFEQNKIGSRPTIAVGTGCALVISSIALWHTAFPRRVDPSDYSEHTVLASWPGPLGTQTWHATDARTDVVVGPEGQSALCGPEPVTLESEAPLLGMENNQIFLVPMRARPNGGNALLQLFWWMEGQNGFVEEQSTLSMAYEGEWADVTFRIPAHPDSSLSHLRLDTGDHDGLSVELRAARVTSEVPGRTLEASVPWSCSHDCEPITDRANTYRTLDRDPYFIGTLDPMSMDFDIRVVVGVKVTGRTVTQSAPNDIYGKLEWRARATSEWDDRNHTDFSLTGTTDWTWVRMNPSLYDGIARWQGELGAIRLVLQCPSYRVIDIGRMTLVKDYRMVHAH